MEQSPLDRNGVFEIVRANPGTVVDVGSGNGAPGIPLAHALPDRTFLLLDASRRRCEFLERYAPGLIALSGCLSGRVSKAILESRMNDAEMELDRLEQIFGRLGEEISRTVMAQWIIRLHDVLTPLMDLLRQEQDPRALGEAAVFDTYQYAGNRGKSYERWLAGQEERIAKELKAKLEADQSNRADRKK